MSRDCSDVEGLELVGIVSSFIPWQVCEFVLEICRPPTVEWLAKGIDVCVRIGDLDHDHMLHCVQGN
jgi:hypothetical protein